MEKQKKVVDASVVFKLFDKNEENSKIAEKLKDTHINNQIQIIIPELIFLEVTNALRWKNQKSESLSKISEALFNLQFDIEKITPHILNKTIQNSIKYNITIYDALYVSIAQFHGCEFITADKELYKIPNVVPLEKYDPAV